jgi:hypothetical protein
VQSVDQSREQVVFERDDSKIMDGRSSASAIKTAYIDADVAAAVVACAELMGLRADKLRRLIEELNDNCDRENIYAAHALLRTILDHIPPLLGHREFQQLVKHHHWSRGDASYVRRLDAFRLQGKRRPASHGFTESRPPAMEDIPPRLWINRLLQECADATKAAAQPPG